MLKKIMLLPLALFLFTLATPASAQNRAGAVTLTPFVGGYTFECFQRLETDWYFGMRIGYNITKHWGAEGMFGYIPTESNAQGFDGRSVNVYRYGGDILYNFIPDKKFVPFLALGFGGIQINDPSHHSDHETAMLDYGLGFKYFITETVALRADVRHNLFCEFNKPCSNLEYTGGVTIQLGGKKHTAAAPPPPPPEEAAAPAPIPVEAAPAPVRKPRPKVILVELDDSHFAHDSSALTREGNLILDKNIQTLKANPDLRIMIAGYASASGSVDYNQKLSERRANAVRNYLIIHGGIAQDRLEQIGYGKTRPAEYEAYPGDIESMAAKANRRVLFTIIVK